MLGCLEDVGSLSRTESIEDFCGVTSGSPQDLTDGGSVSPVAVVSPHGRPQDRFKRTGATVEPPKDLYFLAGAGLIKIGITTNLVSRIRAIRNSSPIPLELLATKPSNGLEEMRAHEKFKHLRRHGEWFEDNGEIREWVSMFTAHARPKPGLSTNATEMRHAWN